MSYPRSVHGQSGGGGCYLATDVAASSAGNFIVLIALIVVRFPTPETHQKPSWLEARFSWAHGCNCRCSSKTSQDNDIGDINYRHRFRIGKDLPTIDLSDREACNQSSPASLGISLPAVRIVEEAQLELRLHSH